MNIMQVKSESAIMACNRLAVLPGMQNDDTRLITILLLGATGTASIIFEKIWSFIAYPDLTRKSSYLNKLIFCRIFLRTLTSFSPLRRSLRMSRTVSSVMTKRFLLISPTCCK
jgi:hypothetical protein